LLEINSSIQNERKTMPRESVVLQIFVASPSDVSEEREILETVVLQLNSIWSNSLGLTFELIKWETHTHPTFGKDPQDAINTQIDLEYDVFIGIFWGRLGTPTPRALSGTIEEFERAYSTFAMNGKSPEIMLYFKDAPISPSKIDPKQLQGVNSFKRSLTEKGGLFWVFEDQAGFESSLRAHLSAIAQKFAAQRNERMLIPTQSTKLSTTEITFSDDNDYGYIDYIEIHEARQAEILSAMNIITTATIRIGEQLSQRTTEVNNGSSIADPKITRYFINLAADDMSSYAEILRIQITILSKAREAAFNALSNALVLRTDFENSNNDLLLLRESLHSLIAGTGIARSGISDMREAAEGIPRISKGLNKAKRSVITQLDSFLSEIDSINSTVINIIEAIDRMTQIHE
jgi:hypothetical protein